MPNPNSLLPIEQAKPPYYVGIDVGGTGIKIGIVDDDGRPVAFTKIATKQHAGAEDGAKRIGQAVQQLTADAGLAPGDVKRAGLVTPGPMDLERGMLLKPGNLPAWSHSPVRDLVAQATGLPVTYANDANAAAYGEYWAGAGRETHNLVMITLGTGVGGGIIVNGRLIVGAHGAGGEVGHIVIDQRDDAPINTLGIHGTLEGYCGSYGVLARTHAALEAADGGSKLSDIPADQLTPLDVANAAESGDPLALGVVMETARYLAVGLTTLIHTIDPEAVVIGGAMTFGGAGHPLGEQFLAEVRKQTRSRIFENLRDPISIEFAELGGDAGFIGAAGLARDSG